MRKYLIPFAAMLFVGWSANAADAPAFADVDLDGDDLISFEEATAADGEWSEESFEAADDDDDEFLNENEYDAAIKTRAQ